ncbi:MAG: phage holin family protein [Hyphomicrobiales bacterium]
MSAKTNTERLNQILDDSKDYLNLKLELFSYNFTQKFVSLTSYLFTFIAAIVLLLLFFFFISFGFVFWWQEAVGKIQYGFFIVGAFYLVLGILLFILRKPLIVNPILRFITKQIREDNQDVEPIKLKSTKHLESVKKRIHKRINKKEKRIQKRVSEILSTFTLHALLQKYSEKIGDKLCDNAMNMDNSIGSILRKIKGWTEKYEEEDQEEEEDKKEEEQ